MEAKADRYGKEIEKFEKEINKETENNLTEARFSDIMLNAMQYSFFQKEIYDDMNNNDAKRLWSKFHVELKCTGDRKRNIGSKYLTATYVLSVYKKYRNENGHGCLQPYKTYWFNIRDVSFRNAENYSENIAKDKEWFALLKQKTIFKYSTVDDLKEVMEKIRNGLFI